VTNKDFYYLSAVPGGPRDIRVRRAEIAVCRLIDRKRIKGGHVCVRYTLRGEAVVTVEGWMPAEMWDEEMMSGLGTA
jgi:hypothetical protein